MFLLLIALRVIEEISGRDPGTSVDVFLDAAIDEERSACLTAGSLSSGCFVLGLERSPSTSVHGSAKLI